MKTALLLIDLQNDYLAASGLEPARNLIVNHAEALLRRGRELAIPVLHVWTTVSRENDQRMPHWKHTNRWNCEAGTPGHEPPAALQPLNGEPVIHKTFFSAFSNPTLEPRLRELGIQTLILSGVHLHACVRQTALDAYERGFEVCIADDATGSDDPVHAAITRRYLSNRAARLLNTESLVAAMSGWTRPSVDVDVRSVVARAEVGYRTWKDTKAETKFGMIERVATMLEKEASNLSQQMADEIGKPILYGETEARRTAEMLRAIIRRCAVAVDEVHSTGVLIRRRPHGIVALVTPWNNPIYIALGKIVPALLCGNVVVWKPSPHAEKVSRALLEIFVSSGCPEEVLQLLCGDRSTAEALMADSSVAAVSITGSSQAGYVAQEICARRRIPLQAELGGNNAAIVWDDAELCEAARRITDGAFGMAGQRCTANRRVIVHEQVYDNFLRMLISETAALHSGDPKQRSTRIGPLVSAEHCARVAAVVDRCAAQGNHIERVKPLNFVALSTSQVLSWHPPVIVCCDDPAAEIVQEETFGPVLVVQKANDWEHAMALCNGVRQGLAAALFSRSAKRQQQFLLQAQAGILKLNQATADAALDVPFGGWKTSGIGPPEHGSYDLDFYLRPQTCYDAAPDTLWK
ncbi:hypothetical protein BH11VER1_BH11VER1_09860 [soil metagenome]